MDILAVSNVSLGYGSPQIVNIVRYLVSYYENSIGIILEPDQPERSQRGNVFSDLNVERIFTNQNPWCAQWRIEYTINCAKKINSIRPDILILIDTVTLPVLEMLEFVPKVFIYYSLEMAEYFGINKSTEYLLNSMIKKARVIIFAEENRRKSFLKDYPLCKVPTVVLYNCPQLRANEEKCITKNGKILYQGTISRELTFADYYCKKKTQKFDIDVFGLIEGENKKRVENDFLKLKKGVRYMGYVDNDVLSKIRRNYAYGLVSWNPVNNNFLYAAPNKFFEYIADGVVPIAAPHPQCKELIDKYKCGILMQDWTYKSFLEALEKAKVFYDTPAYVNLSNRCFFAAENELNWENQMTKIYKYMPDHFKRLVFCH